MTIKKKCHVMGLGIWIPSFFYYHFLITSIKRKTQQTGLSTSFLYLILVLISFFPIIIRLFLFPFTFIHKSDRTIRFDQLFLNWIYLCKRILVYGPVPDAFRNAFYTLLVHIRFEDLYLFQFTSCFSFPGSKCIYFEKLCYYSNHFMVTLEEYSPCYGLCSPIDPDMVRVYFFFVIMNTLKFWHVYGCKTIKQCLYPIKKYFFIPTKYFIIFKNFFSELRIFLFFKFMPVCLFFDNMIYIFYIIHLLWWEKTYCFFFYFKIIIFIIWMINILRIRFFRTP